MPQVTQSGTYYGEDPAGNKNTTGQYVGKSYQGAYNSNGGGFVKATPLPPISEPETDKGSGTPANNYGDLASQIRDLLRQQKSASDRYYKSLYEQQLAQNKQAFEGNRNQANLNYKRSERYINSLYGDAISGSGLSNKVRNNQNWQSLIANARQNYANNDATALASYNQALANNQAQYAQGWYNYVLPYLSKA